MCVTKKRDNASEDGLTIVEVLVAITLLVVVLLVVERGAVAALQAASVAKQHSEATSLVSQTVAQAESLGFGDLWAGLDSSAENLSQDPDIATTGSGSGTTYALKLDNATIATCSTETSETPLVPHINTVSDGISYQVAVYPIASWVLFDLALASRQRDRHAGGDRQLEVGGGWPGPGRRPDRDLRPMIRQRWHRRSSVRRNRRDEGATLRPHSATAAGFTLVEMLGDDGHSTLSWWRLIPPILQAVSGSTSDSVAVSAGTAQARLAIENMAAQVASASRDLPAGDAPQRDIGAARGSA